MKYRGQYVLMKSNVQAIVTRLATPFEDRWRLVVRIQRVDGDDGAEAVADNVYPLVPALLSEMVQPGAELVL